MVMWLFSTTTLIYCQEQNHLESEQESSQPSPTIQNNNNEPTEQEIEEGESEEQPEEKPSVPRRIEKILVVGNNNIPTEAILARIPYKTGEIFDPNKTRRLINNLYYDLKRLRNVSVYAENKGTDRINIYIKVEEKTPLKEVQFKGNKQVTEKELREKINFSEVPAIDKPELKRFALAIQKIYKEKGYHVTEVATDLVIDDEGKATALFTITEHKRGIVKRLEFIGNNHFSSKKLRNVLFSKEDWILSFMDKAGTYQEERIEGDKHAIEQFYQNKGYIAAKVIDTKIDVDPLTQYITITYEIQEGDEYTVSSVKAEGKGILSEDYLISILPLKAGTIYSREQLVESIRALEFIWGDLGYVYANIDPAVQPDEDTKTISVTFHCDIGKPVFLNKITIKGNKKTRDKVIRRKISLEEGGILTNRQMEASKNRIEGLGYFDQRNGVNWKMTRLSDELADLDLFVKEIKTGSAHLQLGFGGAGSISNPANGVTLEGSIADTNLFGSGVRMNLTGRVGAEEKTVNFNLTQPWMFDKPVYGAMDIYHKRLAYDELALTRPVNEKHTGGILTTGFVTGMRHHFFTDTFVRFSLGVNDVHYEGTSGNVANPNLPVANIFGVTALEKVEAETAYNRILAKEFSPGSYVTLSANVGKDAKNHPMHPTRGYTWLARAQASTRALDSDISFYKFDIEANWYTPLIGEFDLILRLHGFAGFVQPIHNRIIPYREMFHIGGPASVRGFLFGQIGPQFAVKRNGTFVRDSIGGDRTFFVNAELIFPILADFSMKGVVFYDGGAGWHNPYVHCIDDKFIQNNNFNYRHAVGFGIRMLNPAPIKIDWGFKLDPRKGERASEVHFGMSYDW